MSDATADERGAQREGRPLRVGLVCPYSWDVPGGVQFHVRDLAEQLTQMGHQVSVLAPADDDAPLPAYLVPAGRAVPVPYNGSVARLTFGVRAAAKVRRWLAEGQFDVLHIHEPTSPSLSLLACWAATGPIVATFHTAMARSRALRAAYPMLQPALDKVTARIAVSEEARRTLVDHLGGDAVVIPNGIYVDRFATATPRPEWQGSTIGFLGRLDEPRKGLDVLLAAFTHVARARPGTRLLVAGRGDAADAADGLPSDVRSAVRFLGQVDEQAKASLLASLDVYVAPNLGGESFGIILIEAMAAGAPVVASRLEAFRGVLDDGRLGVLFDTGDADALAAALLALLEDPARRARLSAVGRAAAARYDWSVVGREILDVYRTVSDVGVPVRPTSSEPHRPTSYEPHRSTSSEPHRPTSSEAHRQPDSAPDLPAPAGPDTPTEKR